MARMNRVKFGLDFLLLVTFLLLMDPQSFYGLVFHEWAGLIIFAFFVIHKILDWKWVKAITLRFFKSLPPKTRINYVLDVILLVSMTLVVWSGLPISRTIDFTWIGFDRQGTQFWRLMHVSLSMVVLLAIGVHLGLHWKWVLARFRRT